jgi:hypothetical protein
MYDKFKKLSIFELIFLYFCKIFFLMKKSLIGELLFVVSFTLLNCTVTYSQNDAKLHRIAAEKMKAWKNPLTEWAHIAKPKLDSLKIDREMKHVNLFFAPSLSYYPFREESSVEFLESVINSLGKKFRKYPVVVYAGTYRLDQLIPNYYRKNIPVDSLRFPPARVSEPLLVRKVDGFAPEKGLAGKSIALWHSHGYYFEMNLDRWEWQRASLFGTVEDISVMGYVLPYLTKMLENAGANLFLPRERDTQTNEVIVDNDFSTGASEVVLHLNEKREIISEGFIKTDTLFPGFNPFSNGTSLRILNDSAVYIPEIPADGSYAVYISYPVRRDNSSSVSYSVSHTGGITEYIVNQTIGGETWIYLGTFSFRAGKNINTGSVTVKASGDTNRYIALDAIRFGGGMGNVARRPSPEIIKNRQSASEKPSEKISVSLSAGSDFQWKISGKPRYLEGSRYWLQYAGMPDSLVYTPNVNKNDYNDDYMSRALWVNYLIDDPYKKAKGAVQGGLGIPIDLSIAFHTDAGVTPGDSIIGTLAIYSTGSDLGKFPDGTSRLASRDLSDIIQTQVVEDIRSLYNPDWTRRGIWDRPYHEARKPNVPGVLLELLSHQNLADQKFGLDPRFRFQVSRSVYKGILKYLSYVGKEEYIVQPLPVNGFAIVPGSGKTIRLSWEPVLEKSEPTSKPDRYILYKRTGDGGFDNGTIFYQPSADIDLDSYNTIYSFKVTAANDGGESFDSEILSAGIIEGDKNPVLVVNGFDRICGPATFDIGNMAGVAWWQDRGVADGSEIIATGNQYDFNRKSPWLDDDSPGWGASYNDMAGTLVPGNTFDFPYIHGKSIMAAGRSFYSISDEYFCSEKFSPAGWKTADLIFGEEKSTQFFNDTSVIDFKIYTPEFMKRIREMTETGTGIFMSGSYVGSDQIVPGDSAAIKFAARVLHFLPRTSHSVKTGGVYTTDYTKQSFSGTMDFNAGTSDLIYAAEAPDAIEPAGKGASCSFRYSENNASAGISYKGNYRTVVLGFPFETINGEKERDLLMKQILIFLQE